MGQRGKTNGAPGSHALLGAKHLEVIGDFIFLRLIVNLHHEIGEAVDDGDALGAFYRLWVCVHHPERLHNPLDPERIFNHRANHCSNFIHICKVSSAAYVLNELFQNGLFAPFYRLVCIT